MSEEDTEKKDDLNRDMARVAWKEHSDRMLASWGYMTSFALSALRLSATVNGATAAILLAFISANHAHMKNNVDLAGYALFAFIIGMITPVIAAGSTYLAQFFFTYAFGHYTLGFDHPYVALPKNNVREKAGNFFQYAGMVLFVASFLSFLFGAWYFFGLVKQVILQA